MSLLRQRYEGGEVPADRLINEVGRVVTLGVIELVCRLGIDSASFRRAAENLLQSSGLRISPEQLRQLVEHEGKRLLVAQQRQEVSPGFAASDCKTKVTPDGHQTTRIYLGVDGVMVPAIQQQEKAKRREKAKTKRKHLPRRKGRHRKPLPAMKSGADQGYKEFKVVTFYDQAQAHRYVRATRKGHRMAGQLIRCGASDLRMRGAEEKVAIADGADWIWNQVNTHVPFVDGKVLDFYHLSEHVHEARRCVFGEGQENGKAWADNLLHRIRHEGYEEAWSDLVQIRTTVRSPAKRRAMDALMRYMAERRDRLDYVRCNQKDWDVGSGSTESMCKAMTRRLKMRGMRWDTDNAEAVMALETLEQTDGWAEWHRYRVASMN